MTLHAVAPQLRNPVISLTLSLILSLTQSATHTLSHSLAQSLTYSLIHSKYGQKCFGAVCTRVLARHASVFLSYKGIAVIADC